MVDPLYTFVTWNNGIMSCGSINRYHFAKGTKKYLDFCVCDFISAIGELVKYFSKKCVLCFVCSCLVYLVGWLRLIRDLVVVTFKLDVNSSSRSNLFQ
mmetsp:Transcript_53229/g.64129  ORF Transcript_53229/g.64129 Transcript_53229/m.64129 type:complete len:98 (+) Transcript_53229:152-445(+)